MKKNSSGKNCTSKNTGMNPPADTRIVLAGAGNVATQLGVALQEKGFPVVQVYSRTWASAEILGNRLQTKFTCDLRAIDRNACLYLFSLADAALPEIIKDFPRVDGLLVHTSGGLSMDVLKEGKSGRQGVLYPLQTFDKFRKISFDALPLFIESNHPEDEDWLEAIALTLSGRVVRLSSDRRKQLHLAAVFACNFTNHLYALAAQLLEKQNLPWDILLPLIRETAAKAAELHPRAAQTGPAIRGDQNVMDNHLELLKENPEMQELYRLLSRSVMNYKL